MIAEIKEILPESMAIESRAEMAAPIPVKNFKRGSGRQHMVCTYIQINILIINDIFKISPNSTLKLELTYFSLKLPKYYK